MVELSLLGDELVRATGGLRRVVRRRLRPSMPEMRGAHVELLRIVEGHPGIGVAAAARIMHLAPNSVSTLVNQLLDAKLLRRETDPEDRRAALLTLTATARRRLTAWRAARAGLVSDGVAALPEHHQQALRAAVPALQALIAVLEDT